MQSTLHRQPRDAAKFIIAAFQASPARLPRRSADNRGSINIRSMEIHS
jgi:hypothetical protein